MLGSLCHLIARIYKSLKTLKSDRFRLNGYSMHTNATASLVARAIISAHETLPAQTFSNFDFARSITSIPWSV